MRRQWNLMIVLVSCFVALMSLGALAPPAEAEEILYTVAGGSGTTPDDKFRVVNPLTGATISSISITLSGETVLGGNGLAMDPLTSELYALLTLDDGMGGADPARELVTLNPVTGVATSKGNTGDRFAGIAFDSAGQLYGITGDGATTLTPRSLYTLNKTNGMPISLLTTLGHVGEGETIGFNPDNGLMYHASGRDPFVPANRVFESVQLTPPFTTTNIPITAPLSYREATALTYEGAGSNRFFAADTGPGFPGDSDQLFHVTTGGVVTLIGPMGSMDHIAKGLVLAQAQVIPEPTTLMLLVIGIVGLVVAWRMKRRPQGAMLLRSK